MRGPAEHRGRSPRWTGWIRLSVGVLLLTGTILILMQGYAPPGPAGAVLRNNLQQGIDATPLFYTELD